MGSVNRDFVFKEVQAAEAGSQFTHARANKDACLGGRGEDTNMVLYCTSIRVRISLICFSNSV